MKCGAKDSLTTNFVKAPGLSGMIIAAATVSAVARKKYDPGVTDSEIKTGNITPYSGMLLLLVATGAARWGEARVASRILRSGIAVGPEERRLLI